MQFYNNYLSFFPRNCKWFFVIFISSWLSLGICLFRSELLSSRLNLFFFLRLLNLLLFNLVWWCSLEFQQNQGRFCHLFSDILCNYWPAKELTRQEVDFLCRDTTLKIDDFLSPAANSVIWNTFSDLNMKHWIWELYYY
jgi:hypothetical protein